MTKQHIDSWLIRGKDITLIITTIGALSALFVVAVKYYNLPTEVSAQASALKEAQTNISELHDYTIRTDGKLARIDDTLKYLKENSDSQVQWLKTISSKLK